MKKMLLMSFLLVGFASVSVAQSEPAARPVRGANTPTVQCEEMKKLVERVKIHRTTCETCKTNLPQRGFGPGPGPGNGQGKGPGNGRGPGGPPQSR